MRILGLIALLPIILATSARADAPAIVLFGAAGTKQASMQACYPKARVVPFAEGESTWPRIVQEINAHPEKKYVVAGHSTAAIFAEHVGRKVARPEQIKLVLLDGYGANDVQRRVDTTCWYARNPAGQESINASSMKNSPSGACNQAKSHTKIYHDTHCHTQWCLHFSLVNRNDPAGLATSTWFSHGWDSCRGNTEWAQ